MANVSIVGFRTKMWFPKIAIPTSKFWWFSHSNRPLMKHHQPLNSKFVFLTDQYRIWLSVCLSSALASASSSKNMNFYIFCSISLKFSREVEKDKRKKNMRCPIWRSALRAPWRHPGGALIAPKGRRNWTFVYFDRFFFKFDLSS